MSAESHRRYYIRVNTQESPRVAVPSGLFIGDHYGTWRHGLTRRGAGVTVAGSYGACHDGRPVPGRTAARPDRGSAGPPGQRPLPVARGPRQCETRAWLGAEDELFRSHAADLPGVTALTERILELTGTGHIGVPVWRGPRRFFTRRLPGRGARGAVHGGSRLRGPRGSRPGDPADPGPGTPPIPARGPRRSRRRADAHRPDGHRYERADHARRLAAGQGRPVAGLPAVRGRQRGVTAAGHGRGNRRAGGRADRPLPLLADRVAAGRARRSTTRADCHRTRCPLARSSFTAGSTCTGWAHPPTTT